jgi:glycosyltransferase involved in cell wall biosynthesis
MTHSHVPDVTGDSNVEERKPAPLVSIVLPVFNREHLVARAIDSVLAQTFSNFELIIVDDCSTDSTRSVLERYRDTRRVTLIFSEKNLGGGGARNLGISHASGSLIAFQDSDDIWLPMKLAEQVSRLERQKDAGLCYCGALFTEGTQSYYIPEPIFDKLDGDMSEEILRRNTTSTQTLLIRREVLEESGLFDPTFKRYQDWDLMIRIAQITDFLFLSDPMVIICATPNNISSVSVNDAIYRSVLLEKYSDLFEKRPDFAARNHYIAGSIWLKAGNPQKGKPHFWAALNLQPGLKAMVQLLRSFLSRSTSS